MRTSKWRIVAAAVGSLLLTAAHAAGADYPEKTVRLILGNPPGGGSDTYARVVAQHLSEKWGQPVVIENKDGADGTIAADIVAKSPPDGYTLFLSTSALSAVPSLRELTFDPVNSFAHITKAVVIPEVLTVTAGFEAKTLDELIALAKAKPDSLAFGATGPGGAPFLEMARFMKSAGVNILPVNYKGVSAALPALLGGEVQMMFQNSASAQAAVNDGTLRALAITGDNRSAALPDVPTFKEAAGIADMNKYTLWYGFAAPAGTPEPVVQKIYDDIKEVMAKPEVSKKFADGGLITIMSTPQQTGPDLAAEIDETRELIEKYAPKK